MRLLALLVFALSPLFALPAYACSCVKALPPAELSGSVFEGKVMQIELTVDSRIVSFEVLRAWHGVDSSTVTVETGYGDSDCGFDFAIEETYLVFAGDPPERRVSSCSGTRLSKDAGDALANLGEPNFPSQDGGPRDASVAPDADAAASTVSPEAGTPNATEEPADNSEPTPAASQADGCSVVAGDQALSATPMALALGLGGLLWARRRRAAQRK